MSGISPISSQVSGLAAVFQARANIPALLRANNQYRESASILANPTPNLAVNASLRDLRTQRSSIQADVNQNSEFDSRLQTLQTGLSSIANTLNTIKTLVDDTIATPGNAAANQAAIDNLVAGIKNQVSALRAVEPQNPTFLLSNVDARISDLALFSADGSRIDTNGINVDINVTNDARRAEIFTFLSNYYLTDAATNIRVRGPGGDSATINLNPAGSSIANAIRNVDRNNTEVVTFEVYGGNHLGTVDNNTTPQLISTVAGTAAVITDAIVGINELLNYGDTTLSITTETSGGAVNFVISGGTQANRNNAITNFNTTFNSGSGSFQVGNVDGGGSLQTINFNGGTQGTAASVITGVNTTLNTGATTVRVVGQGGTQDVVLSGGNQAIATNAFTNISTRAALNTGNSTVTIQGNIGSTNVVVSGGTQGIRTNALTNITTRAQFNTGDSNVTIAGSLGSSAITISGGARAQTGNVITNEAGNTNTGAGTNSVTVRLTDSAGTNSTATLNFARGLTTRAAIIGALTTSISGSGLAGRVTAYDTGSGIGFRTVEYGSGTVINVTAFVKATAGTLNIATTANASGTAGASQATIIGQINGVRGSTGVTAVANGAAAINLQATDAGGTAVFGSSASAGISTITGGNAGGATTGTTNGTAGASQAAIIAAINAAGVRSLTGVTAVANGGNAINLTSTDASGNARFGSTATARITAIAGGNAGGAAVITANGTAGLTLAQVATAINTVANTTKVFATVNGANIDIKASLDGAGTNAFGSAADVSLQFLSGGNAVTVPGGTGNGNAGDTRAIVTTAINATTALSRVVATDDGTNIDIRATDALGNNVFGSNSNVVVVNNATSNTAGTDFLLANNTDINGNIGHTRADVINTINALRYNGGVNPTGVIASAGTLANTITLTTSSVGTTDVGQRDDDGVIGTGNIEQITVANVITPGPTQIARVGTTTNASGTNSTTRDQLIALINAVNAATEVTASASGTYNITLTSDLLGLGADVNLRPVTNPETTAYTPGSVFPAAAAVNNEDITFYRANGTQLTAGNREVQYGTVVGINGGDTPNAATFTAIRDEALLRINTAANPIGVEAFVHDSSNGPTDPAVTNDNAFSLSLRSFLFGGAFRVDVDTGGGVTGAGGLNRDADTVLNNPFDIGEHAVATVVVDGSTAQTLTSTNPGNNPATLSGGNFAFGENGVSVNQFSFNVNGVIGQFSVPVDEIFDPAAVTAEEDTSLFLPLVDAQNNFLTRFNFNTLDANFLGEFVFDRNNIETRGRTGVQGPEVPRGGIKDIDVTTSTAASTAIIDQAIADVALDLSTANTLRSNLVSPLVTEGQTRLTQLDAQTADLEDYRDALLAAQEVEASEQIDTASSILAQLSLLFPTATLPLLNNS